MKLIYLFLSCCLLTAVACNKELDNNTTTPPLPPGSPSVSIFTNRWGGGEILGMLTGRIGVFAAMHGEPRTKYTYELTSSNGLKNNVADNPVSGEIETDSLGGYAWKSIALYPYKDGTLTFKVYESANTNHSFSVTAEKEQFIIKNYQDFCAIDVTVFKPDTSASYVQANDFAFPDSTYSDSPLSMAFKGSYDGQGHVISNLTINAQQDDWRGAQVALFDTISATAIVKNIRLELSSQGITNPNPSSLTAGIAALHKGTILGCSVKGKIVFTDASSGIAGGIVAETRGGHIVGTSFTGRLEGNKIGGIAGDMFHSDIRMCYADFSAKSDGMIGGIVDFTYLNADGGDDDVIVDSYVHFSSLEGIGAANAGGIYATGTVQNGVALTVTRSFTNGPADGSGATIYSTVSDLTTSLSSFTASAFPAYLTLTLPGNKPYKANSDATKPPLLWWQ